MPRCADALNVTKGGVMCVMAFIYVQVTIYTYVHSHLFQFMHLLPPPPPLVIIRTIALREPLALKVHAETRVIAHSLSVHCAARAL